MEVLSTLSYKESPVEMADKLDFKKGVIAQIGSRVEELLEGAESSAAEARGAKKALREQGKQIIDVIASVDSEVEKSIPDLETAKLIKSWLTRVAAATEQLAAHMAEVESRLTGAVSAHKVTHDALQKMAKGIDEQKQRLAASVESQEIVVDAEGQAQVQPGAQRPTGVRPAATIKELRLKEEQEQPAPKVKKAPKRAKKAVRKPHVSHAR